MEEKRLDVSDFFRFIALPVALLMLFMGAAAISVYGIA
jgi:hypothetical protein